MPTYFKRKSDPVHNLQVFLSRVSKSDSCWLWTGAMMKNGYGRLWHDWTMHLAHRVSWQLHIGPIKDGLWVLHRCDNPKCVRPAHLFLGLPRDNSADMVSKGRQNSPTGHRHRSRTHPESIRRGERCTTSKLTANDVLVIRANIDQSYSSIAKAYGISLGTVGDIKRGERWKRLLPPTAPASVPQESSQ